MICSSNRLILSTLLIVSTLAVNVLGTETSDLIDIKDDKVVDAVVDTVSADEIKIPVKIIIDDSEPQIFKSEDNNNKTEIISAADTVLITNPTPPSDIKQKRCINCGNTRFYYRHPDGRLEERYISPQARSLQYGILNKRQLKNIAQQQGCSPGVCGTAASCREVGDRPVCSCPPGYEGNPLTHCSRPECLDHIECPLSLACKNGHCTNPCNGACGAGAICEPRNHVAVCSCPRNHEGDPYHSCRPSDPEQQCHPSPCGANTKCEIIGGVPTCSCLTGFEGNPLSGCRHECEFDGECGSQEMCRDFKCVKACSACGTLANCVSVVNHRAVCECPKGYIGSPYTECRPECYGDVDCPSNKPACFYGICKNTCEGACGVGADCKLRGLTPVCSCPRDMTGDPFIRCRPFTKEDLCEPNPCGTNAICIPGHDNTGKERPVCNCAPGHTGNPLTHCARGECQSNEECSDSQACINYQCVNPCIGKCGSGATCEPKAHLAVCKCPPGTAGDAIVSCRKSRTIPVAKYH